MTPEERAEHAVEQFESVFESGGVGYAMGVVAAAIRVAVEEEREACAVLSEELMIYTGPGGQDPELFQKMIAKHIRARGKQKFCGCGRPSKDPVTGGCGEC